MIKRIKHLNILPPTLLLGLATLVSSLLGVFRDRLLARNFGATSGEGIYDLDVYYAAFKIPDLLYFILITGAISAAFIPTFTQYKKEGKLNKAWEFASNMLHLMLIGISVVSVIAFIFAPQLTRLVASGFEPEAFELTVKLMRIMLISPLIFTFSAVFMSLQDSFKTFFFRSLSPIFYNLGIILAILFFSENFGVVGVTWGVIFGALLSLLIQLPSLKNINYKHFWLLDFKKPDVQKAFRTMLPRVLSGSMYQVSQLIYTLIGSFLVSGSITILYFANNLYSLPLSVVAVSFSITSFATLSELATEKTTTLFASEIKRVTQQILFLVFPATVGMILLRLPLIDTIFLTGEFTVEDAELTSWVLLAMLFSLFTHSLNLLFVRGFFAYHDTKTPFYANFFGAIAGVILAFLLAIPFELGVIGIGIAITVSNILIFSILYALMRRKVSEKLIEGVTLLKMLGASFLMGLVVYGGLQLVQFPPQLWAKVLYLIGMGLVGVLVYFGLACLFKIPERSMLRRQIKGMK